MTNRATLKRQVNQAEDVNKVLKDWQIKLVERHLSDKKEFSSNKINKATA
ncbi:MAG: hypothetical protein ACRBCK_02680 [Alphaproteobacteria bacterium]